MRIIARVAASVAVLSMPLAAWQLAGISASLGSAWGPASTIDDAVTIGAAGFGAAVSAYLAITGYALMIGALARGGRSLPQSIAALTPTAWQRITATALGVTMSAGLASPALAEQPSTTQVGWTQSVPAETLMTHDSRGRIGDPAGWTAGVPASVAAETLGSGGNGHSVSVGFGPAPAAAASPATWPQEQPPSEATADTHEAEAAPAAAGHNDAASLGTYTVQPGDSLWRITSHLLGPQASDAAIAAAWPELYAANAAAIGADASLIHPGQLLAVPEGLTS